MDVTCTMTPYYEVFMSQFMQTMGVFTATLVTATIGYPVLNYYTRRLAVLKRTIDTEESDSE